MTPTSKPQLLKPQPDEFEVSEISIIHKPTEYTFVPYPGKPSTGVIHKALPDGRKYDPRAVAAMSAKKWAAFVLRGAK